MANTKDEKQNMTDVATSPKTEFKQIRDLNIEEIKALPRFRVEFARIVNEKFGSTNYALTLVLDSQMTVKAAFKDFGETDYNLIGMAYGKPDRQDLLVASCPCRFVTGKSISKKTGNLTDWYMVQIVANYHEQIYFTVWFRGNQFKLFQTIQTKGRLSYIQFIKRDDVLDSEDVVFEEEIF